MACLKAAVRPSAVLIYETYTLAPRCSPKWGIENRLLKHVLLDLLVVNDSAASHRLIIDH